MAEDLAATRAKYYKPIAKASREARHLTVKSGDASEPSTTFAQPDRLDGEEVQAFVLILRTRGCRWALTGGCTFCGYVNDSFIRKIEPHELVEQARRGFARHEGQPIAKIYTSGSFLDPYEVDEEAQAQIAALVPPSVRKLNVEAQAVDVTEARVRAIRAAMPEGTKLEIGVGLETASRDVARFSVNKEFFLDDFLQASRAAAASGATLKCYTMVKPPFLTEEEALADCVATARLAGPHASTVSLNPMNIQKHTLVEDLWKRGQYRPPWLWTVVEALREGKRACPQTVLKSDPVAGGKRRGAHNCGRCDEHVLKAIAAFSVSQDERVFGQLSCPCRRDWEDQLAMEALFQGAYPDPRDAWAGTLGVR
ncbi:MAG TPA: archaeosine biosynthesis radical SAM protein RaSEA [Candidatus Thermoplasmatota archaeon]|nr:archaeosine biosynthesis radical SAM protein RaSEA [Candidatus Thermoplasmatota archaeon]